MTTKEKNERLSIALKKNLKKRKKYKSTKEKNGSTFR